MRKRERRHEPNLFSLRCDECGEYLVSTPSGYLACPRGHGKLVSEEPAGEMGPCGMWFEDSVPGGK